MPLGKPFLHRRRQQKPRLPVDRSEIAHDGLHHARANQLSTIESYFDSRLKSDRLLEGNEAVPEAIEEVEYIWGLYVANNHGQTG